MNLRTSFTLAACLAISCLSPVYAGQYTENFSSPAKPDGTVTGWTLPSEGFSEQAGALAYDASTDKNIAVWSATPVGTTITYIGYVTPTDAPGTDWSVAGIGIYSDDQNYWHLALVQAPDNLKKDHFEELSEMDNGNWNAQGTAPTALTVNNDVPSFEWVSGVTYEFKITLTPTQIQGQVLDAGVVKYSCSAQFSAPAVTKGRPMLDDAGIKATFTKLSADISGS